MKNFIAKGEALTYTVPTGQTVTSGTPVVVGSLLGIPVTSGAAGDTVALSVCGVFDVPKLTTTGEAFVQGAKVYWDAGAATTDDSKLFVGYAYAAAVQTATTVQLLLPL